MLEGLRTAAAGMMAQQDKLDAVANDLANANTDGYKSLRVGFADLMYDQAGRPSAKGVELGTGARSVQTGRLFEQGALKQTGNPLDVAIEGEGFLKVKMDDGSTAMTRDGDLHVDGKGRLVTELGGIVQPQINVPAGTTESQISIAQDGTVAAAGKTLGKIALVTVRSPQNLQSVGDNAFLATAKSGAMTAAPAASVLKQGALESSNTDVSTAMTDMIDAQRTYQLTSKAIQTADQMMEIANQVKK
jgi:flagellar basal-body rod protein FlgG